MRKSFKEFWEQTRMMLLVIALIVGGVTGMFNIFATCDDLDALADDTKQTFQQLRQDITEDGLEASIRRLTELKYSLRDSLRKYPNDTEIKEDYDIVLERLKQAIKELKELEASK